MADLDVEETVAVSDISEGSSSGANNGTGGGGLVPTITGVRNYGLPPFVMKLYNIVCDKASDSTISWAPNQTENQVHGGATSFVIWNEKDFINNILPLMSRSNNFDSFIAQLNNYGFKKISWYRREYANQWFQEKKPHLLKNLKRRSKQNASEARKLTLEIRKLERESNEFDLERNMFKQYVDNTMSNQKRIIQVMAKTIKSTFDHHRHSRNAYMSNEAENNNQAIQSLNWVGVGQQQGRIQ